MHFYSCLIYVYALLLFASCQHYRMPQSAVGDVLKRITKRIDCTNLFFPKKIPTSSYLQIIRMIIHFFVTKYANNWCSF